MSNKKPVARIKHTCYLDKDPDVNEMIHRATKADGRTFSHFAVLAIRDWLLAKGYGDGKWKGKRYSAVKCVRQS